MTRLDNAFLDRFEELGPIARNLSRLIRPAIIARPGKTLVWGDWSAIEARTLPWLANSRGSEKVLDIFRANDKDTKAPDIYRIEAGNIFNKPATEIGKGPERQTGKVAVLSLGFGGAEGALMAMATNYGIYLSPAQQTHIVQMWRANNPWAKAFWGAHGRDGSYGLWGAINSAIENPGSLHEAGRVAYVYDRSYLGGSLMCALPCGRVLTYPDIRWERREVKDKKTGEVVEKTQLTYLKGYGRAAMWYGKAAENVTQATAGSLLRATLVRLRGVEDWMPVVAHTHDEIVTECDEDAAEEARDLLYRMMTENAEWSAGLPLAAEITTSWYYTKAGK